VVGRLIEHQKVYGLGQQSYDIDTSSYVWINKKRVNLYLQPYYEQAPVLDDIAGNVGLSWGLMVNDRFTAGSFVSVKVDNTYVPLVFPNSFIEEPAFL